MDAALQSISAKPFVKRNRGGIEQLGAGVRSLRREKSLSEGLHLVLVGSGNEMVPRTRFIPSALDHRRYLLDHFLPRFFYPRQHVHRWVLPGHVEFVTRRHSH